MTANISTNQFGKANFIARGNPAWWDFSGNYTFGKDEKLSLTEALYRANGEFEISIQEQISVVAGNYVTNPSKYSVVRHPIYKKGETEYKWLGEVGSRYSLIQNIEFTEMFDEISEKWPVETVGFLGNGETLFFALDGGDMYVKDDLIHNYFVLYDDKIGKRLTGIMFTPVRVVCQNTLSLGISQANHKLQVKHYNGNKEKVQAIADVVSTMQKSAEEINQLFNNMVNTPFSIEQFKTLVYEKLIPQKKEENALDMFLSFDKKGMENYAAGKELERLFGQYVEILGDNKYSAYQAATEYYDWYKPTKGNGDNWKINTLFGDRSDQKELAFSEIMKI